MQHKITKPTNLLDKGGELIQKGYATSPILKYQRNDVAKILRLKEWDYYLIYNDSYAVSLTVGKSSCLILISASMIDFKDKKEITKSVVRVVPKGKLDMPESSEAGDITYEDKRASVSFLHDGPRRKLFMKITDTKTNSDFEASILLFQEPKDSMVIATPFKEDKKAFYYNQKIIGMNASGAVCCDGKSYFFSPNNSYMLLDWGRGVWPYKSTWYWSAGQGMISSNLFGFNLGYGFGDTSAATENMLFYNGSASKLEKVVFDIPMNEKNEYDYMKPWTITSSDQKLIMQFEPIFKRSVNQSLILLSMNLHQVFGKFTGIAILDDGTIVFLKDFLGFAERVENRW